MSAKIIIVQKLLNDIGLRALVDKKIYPNKAPDKVALPYIIISKPGNENRQLLEGDAGFQKTRIRIECVAANSDKAGVLQRVVFDALKNMLRETITNGVPGGFSAEATVIPTDFETDGYSDAREADVEIFDVYVNWRFN